MPFNGNNAANMTYQASNIDAALGALVSGLDLNTALDSDTINSLQALWRERLVLVFRDQQLDDDALIRFSRQFGELDPPGPNPYGKPINPDNPLINIISNIKRDGEPIGNLGDGEAVWHADMTYQETPPKGAVLHALELPAAGGNTYFSNMYAAYAELDDETRQSIEQKRAVHDASRNSAGMLRKGYADTTDVRQTAGAHQPLIRTNPATGDKCLFLGRRPNSYITDMTVEQSEACLNLLWDHATKDRFTMTHEWRLGDVVMWDNLSVLHRRDAFDPTSRRRLHRTQLRGDEIVQ